MVVISGNSTTTITTTTTSTTTVQSEAAVLGRRVLEIRRVRACVWLRVRPSALTHSHYRHPCLSLPLRALHAPATLLQKARETIEAERWRMVVRC